MVGDGLVFLSRLLGMILACAPVSSLNFSDKLNTVNVSYQASGLLALICWRTNRSNPPTLTSASSTTSQLRYFRFGFSAADGSKIIALVALGTCLAIPWTVTSLMSTATLLTELPFDLLACPVGVFDCVFTTASTVEPNLGLPLSSRSCSIVLLLRRVPLGTFCLDQVSLI